jgi:hypothetical protein
MSVGSRGQQRAHPCMAAIRPMSTESRLMEIELGLTPVAESRAGTTKALPTLSITSRSSAVAPTYNLSTTMAPRPSRATTATYASSTGS